MSPMEPAYRDATRAPVNLAARELQEAVGQRLVAYATETGSPQAVGRWATGANEPRPDAERKLRALYRVLLIMRESEEPRTIRAWLLGSSPELADQAPIELLRDGQESSVFRAAETFVDG